MALLSDQEIKSLLNSGRLIIDPNPGSEAYSPSTVDLTLSNRFREIKGPESSSLNLSIDLDSSASAMEALSEISKEVTVEAGESYELKPGRFVLGWTRERIVLPDFLAARVEGRSTPARFGLSVHQSAPTVHPTYSGQLQLELTNAGPVPINLFPDQRICQLILETMSIPALNPLKSVHQSASD